jgi:hypothetical protein
LIEALKKSVGWLDVDNAILRAALNTAQID